MGDKSKIAWTDATWNPIKGCTPISEGCVHCYAARMADRLRAMGVAGYEDGFAVGLREGVLDQPLRWRRPRKIFVCSMGDLFHEAVPTGWIDQVWATMLLSPQHIFQVLTKRPARMLEYLSDPDLYGRILRIADQAIRPQFPATQEIGISDPSWRQAEWIWAGVTAESQARADERIPLLLEIPAAVRFVSVEPMLGPVDLGLLGTIPHSRPYSLVWERIGWIICGCESGPSARPLDLDWARSLRDQCQDAGVPFFFKQAPDPRRPGRTISMPPLDGQVWAQFPGVRP